MPPASIAFVAADTEPAELARRRLTALYGDAPTDSAAVIVALGGDGFMLEALRATINRDVAVYGMNRGSVGC
jgi:NAD+ kinase